MLWRACRGNVFLRQAMIEDALEDPANVSITTLKRALRMPLDIQIVLIFDFTGRQRLQVGVYHLLPRRSAENARQEDLRRFPRHIVPVPRGTGRSS